MATKKRETEEESGTETEKPKKKNYPLGKDVPCVVEIESRLSSKLKNYNCTELGRVFKGKSELLRVRLDSLK